MLPSSSGRTRAYGEKPQTALRQEKGVLHDSHRVIICHANRQGIPDEDADAKQIGGLGG